MLKKCLTIAMLWSLAATTSASARPIPGDPARVIHRVLAYPSMANVAQDLTIFQTSTNGMIQDGWEVVRVVLWGYDPTLPNQDVERHVAARLRHFAVPDHADRVYLANVAHMVWVEWSNVLRGEYEEIDPDDGPYVPGGSGFPGVLARPVARFGWSLRDYTRAEIDTYLLGPTWKHASYPEWSRYAGTKNDNYNFKHYKNAKAALDRMVGFHADVEWRQESAVARLVEWVGDHFQHFYSAPGEPGTQEAFKGDAYWGNQQDQDLSEAYQRRVGGCGTSSAATALLARSINVPAAVDLPFLGGANASTRDEHRHAFFPTLERPWIHGDAILSSGSMGLLADRLFWTSATIAAKGPTSRDLFRHAIAENGGAKSDLSRARGVGFASSQNLRRSATHSRSQWTDSGHVDAGADWDYVFARYDHMSPSFPKAANGIDFLLHIPDRKYALLDEVAAHWTLDGGTQHGVADAMLGRTDGEDLGRSLRKSASAVRGDALHFHGRSFVSVDDAATLRRNDEELTLSLWVRPSGEPGFGSLLFRRAILAMPDERELPRYDFAYSLELAEEDVVEFAYQIEGSTKVYRLRSPEPLPAGEWSHVVVTYDSTGEVLLWIDGIIVAGDRAEGPLPMAHTWYESATKTHHYAPYPALTAIGLSYVGDLDDIILYYSTLTPSQVEQLHASY